ncbi:MAG: GGDEF domain-containing protein, partial [Leptolyngbya sp. SIO4C1]|nr:GGDEF domain-containing protein [Leptolyngbya sp. SIO4C1]
VLADRSNLEFSLLLDRLLEAQVKSGLRRARLYRDLAQTNDWLSTIALIDSLTQIGNRRAFDIELPRQIHHARRRSLGLCLMMLDIDYFKEINDGYGHIIGDQVLQQLAEQLRGNMRFYDTPFRYGGEEFVVILSNTDVDEAHFIGQRLCNLIANRAFGVSAALNLKISVSIGIANLRPEDDPRGQSLLNRADQCLLKAKTGGRNQVVVSG